MTHVQFNALAQAANLRASMSFGAARRVLVDGLTISAAARESGIDKGGLSRYLSRFPVAVCHGCGSPMKKIPS